MRLLSVLLISALAGPGAPTAAASSPAIASSAPTPAPPLASSAPATAPAAPAETEIRRTIRLLNHPSPSRRRAAIRQLAGWGPLAFPQLREAATGPNLEEAVSARDLLAEMESAILLGALVRLELSRSRVAWDEPVTLAVQATNPSAGPMRVPWPASERGAASRPAGNADQVARMMDAADFLMVTGPDGRAIDLRVEPIERDPAVYQAVDRRARGEPPSHLIAPGQVATLSIGGFNRGWARYPLLAAGRYRIRFDYQPKWKDLSWTKEGFGRVIAEPVELEVQPGAPAPIQQAAVPLQLRIRPAGAELHAELVSAWDLPLAVNLNLGGAALTHARLEWRLIRLRVDDAEPVTINSPASDPRFDPARIVVFQPGETRVIGALPLADVRARAGELSEGRPAAFALSIRYTNLAGPTQLRDELDKLGQPGLVPTALFSGALMSDEYDLSGW